MINKDSKNTTNKGDIVDWKESDKFSFSSFRRKQQKMLDLGFKQSIALTTIRCACPDCDLKQANLIFTKGQIELCFCLCVQCWQVVQLYPVYDSCPDTLQSDSIVTLLTLLDEDQRALVEGLIGVLTE